MAIYIIDSVEYLEWMLVRMDDLPTNPPSFYLDAEGRSLGRSGTLALLQIYNLPQDETYLVDIHVLKAAAFDHLHPAAGGMSLRDILEDVNIPKVFFAIANDAGALFVNYNIKLDAVIDVQIMAHIAKSKRLAPDQLGLAECIKEDAGFDPTKLAEWEADKKIDKTMYIYGKGGNPNIWHKRPLSPKMVSYAAGDVTVLPTLVYKYVEIMSLTQWMTMLRQSDEKTKRNQRPVEEAPAARPEERQRPRIAGGAIEALAKHLALDE